jgi:hypothetical protein
MFLVSLGEFLFINNDVHIRNFLIKDRYFDKNMCLITLIYHGTFPIGKTDEFLFSWAVCAKHAKIGGEIK